MSVEARQLRWGVEKRLEFIEFRLFWDAGINRSDLIEQFDISVPQASNDLAAYQAHAPKNVEYDKSQKRYVVTQRFKPVFLDPDPDRYLSRLQETAHKEAAESQEWIASPPPVDLIPIPHRTVSARVLKTLLQVINERKSLEVKYQSMSSKHPKAMLRWITPHAFANDGFRWHVRAYCHIDRRFKDFLLSRMLDVKETAEPGATPEDDKLWNEFFGVILVPNPKLSEDQQRVIAQDYGMKNSRAKVSVRRALLFYFKKRLRLDVADALDQPQEVPIILENAKEFEEAMSDKG